MWLKKLKKKKFQFILIALMLCFTATIFSACICFVAETKSFTGNYTSYLKCPRIIAICSDNYDKEYFESNKEIMDKTDRIGCCKVTILQNNFYLGEKQIKSYYNTVYNIDSIDSFMHDLKMLDGNEVTPAEGEIWISSVCADSYNISLGDKINAGSENGEKFTVSGIVATPICASAYMGVMPYYVCSESAKLLDGTQMNGISFFSNEDIAVSDYKNILPDEFLFNAFVSYSADEIELSISYLADIFGGVGVLAAVIIFCVSLVIIRFIIMSNLAGEYREIGTYKALGFTDRQIIAIYIKSFVFSGSIGIMLGALFSFPISRYLCRTVLHGLGSFSLTEISVILAISSAVLLTILLTLGVIISTNRIKKITPVEAFSTENPSSKRKVGSSLIKNAYSPLSTAINNIALKKGASAFTIIVLTVSFYMSLLFSSVNYSLSQFDKMTGEWFAFPQYDAIVSLNDSCEVEKFLESSDYVEKYVKSNLGIDLSGMTTNDNKGADNFWAEVYDNCSKEMLGIPLIEGRHPKADDEILLSYDLSKKTGIKTGEWFHLENGEYSNEYLVTGLFSSMLNGGFNITINGDEFAKYKLSEGYVDALVFLKDGVTYSEFENAAKAVLPYETISKTQSFLEGTTNSLNSISKPLTTMFVIIFSVFSILNIINLLIMNNIENRRQYGILKAMGFTNGYICMKNLLKILLLTVASASLALILHTFISSRIFFGIIHVNGLVPNTPLTIGVTAAITVLIIFITMIFTIPLTKVSPTELMEE